MEFTDKPEQITFDDMLNELYDNLTQSNDNLNIKLPEPQLIKNGSNYIWKNVKAYLKLVKRPPDHFVDFIKKETTWQVNWITSSKSDGLILNQKKINTGQIIDIMKAYLKEYVICKGCKSISTYIEKDKNIRKYNFICLNCHMTQLLKY